MTAKIPEGSMGPRADLTATKLDFEPTAKARVKKSTEKKNLKAIEKKVLEISKDCDSLSNQLDLDILNVRQGMSDRTITDLNSVQTQIMLKQSELLDLSNKLSHLSRYEKSSKLTAEIVRNKRRLELVEKKRVELNQLKGSDLSKAYELKREFNEQIKTASKEKKFPARELYKAVLIYNEMKKILINDLPPEHRKQIEAELKFMRIKMTTVSKGSLNLKKAEKKIIEAYETKDTIRPKDVDKLREALTKMALAEKYFPHTKDSNRYNTVNRWFSGFIAESNKQRTTALVDGSPPLTTFVENYLKGDVSSLIQIPEAADIPGDNLNKELEGNIQTQHVRKDARKWTKIKFGFFGTGNKELKKIAKEIEELGIRVIKTSNFLDQRVVDLSSGKVTHYDVQQELKEVKTLIENAEQKLENLRAEVASHGYVKVGAKVEQVIARESNIIDSLKRKQSVLETFAQPEFYTAVSDYNEIISCVRDAMNDEKVAGFRLYEAHHKLDHLRVTASKINPSSPVRVEVDLMLSKAESAIQTAVAQEALTLTKDKASLKEELATDYNEKDLQHDTKDRKNAARRIAIILSKQLTEAMYYYQPPIKEIRDAKGAITNRELDKEHFEEMMASLESVMNNISTLSPSLWEEVLSYNDGAMQRILTNFQESNVYSKERETGVALRNEAVRNVQRAQTEKDRSRIGIHLSHARTKAIELTQLRLACSDKLERLREQDQQRGDERSAGVLKDKIGQLEKVSKHLEKMRKGLGVELDSVKSLNTLTKHKRKLREQIIEGTLTKQHNQRRLTLILSREVAKGLFAENPSVFSELVQMLRVIEKENPELMQKLSADQDLQSVMQEAVNFLMLKVDHGLTVETKKGRESLVPLVEDINYIRSRFGNVAIAHNRLPSFSRAESIAQEMKPEHALNPLQGKLEEAFNALTHSGRKGFVIHKNGAFAISKKKPSKAERQKTVSEILDLVVKSNAAGTGNPYFEISGELVHVTTLVDLLSSTKWGREELSHERNKPAVDAFVKDGLKMAGTYMPKISETLQKRYSSLKKSKELPRFLTSLTESMRMISDNSSVLTAVAPVEFGKELKEEQASFTSLTALSEVRNRGLKEKLEEEIKGKGITDDSQKLEIAQNIQKSALQNMNMVCNELYSTEESFSSNISLLGEKTWTIKGQKEKGTIYEALESVKAITPEERELLSQGWVEFSEMSQQVLAGLEGLKMDSTLTQSQKAKIIHDTFNPNNVDDFFNLFAVIVNNYNKSLSILNKAESHPEGKILLEKFKKKNKGGLSVESILIQPVQRAPRYGLLLGEYNKFADRAALNPQGVERLDYILNYLKQRTGAINKMF